MSVLDTDLLDPVDPPTLSAEQEARIVRQWMIVAGLILLVHAPFLISLSSWLWRRDHYQYFPLILIAFGWLVSIRRPGIQWLPEQSFSIRHALYLSVSGLLFIAAVRANSNLLGLLSCLLTLWTSVWYFGGLSAAGALRGPFCFLLMLAPLPLNLDQQLIVNLQVLASDVASRALDLAGIRHTLSGIVVQTTSKLFLVEETCSGIHSLFSAVAAMLLFCVYQRYGWFRIVMTVAATVFWVVLANAIRVFLVVYSESRFAYSLDTGWRHEALGVLTYVTAMFLSLSTDQLFRFMVPISVDSMSELQAEFFQRVTLPLRLFIFRLLDSRYLSGRAARLIPAIIFGVVFVGLGGVIGVRRMLTGVSAPPRNVEVEAVDFLQDRVESDSLAGDVNGWHQDTFKKTTRKANDPFGVHSAVWSYSGYGMNVLFSLDGYYDEWHDLRTCYRGSGWEVQAAKNDATDDGELEIPHTELRLVGKNGNQAAVFFSCFDSTLQPVTPPNVSDSLLQMLQSRLRNASFIETPQQNNVVPPVFQVQLMAEADRDLLPHEQAAIQDLFRILRAALLPKLAKAP